MAQPVRIELTQQVLEARSPNLGTLDCKKKLRLMINRCKINFHPRMNLTMTFMANRNDIFWIIGASVLNLNNVMPVSCIAATNKAWARNSRALR